MPIYYMFLVILLLIVLLSISVKEGLDAEDRVGDIYNNYKTIDTGFSDYSKKFKSLVM